MFSPLLTEKSTRLAGTGVFTFIATTNETKDTMKLAVANQYKVDVVSITSVNRVGKLKQAGRRKRTTYRNPSRKLFYVRLAEGQKISDFEVNK